LLWRNFLRVPIGSTRLKLDDYWALGLKTQSNVELWSRNQKDFTRRFPTVANALKELPNETVIDGEIVAVDDKGLPSFNLLQNFDGAEQTSLFYVFDLLVHAGKDLRHYRLDERRELLLSLTRKLSNPISYSETFDVSAAELLKAVRLNGLEGVVAKRRSSTYEAGRRSVRWVKLRANRGQEFVIGGYVPTVSLSSEK
jgi:bifunctional non-homologous end joining protein LigD